MTSSVSASTHEGLDFIDSLSAGMSGLPDADAYRQRQQAVLEHLDQFKAVPRITDEVGREKAWLMKQLLGSLWCFLVNRQDARSEEVGALEYAWATELARWSRRLEVKDPTARTVARYLRWNRHFPRVSPAVELALGARYGVLRRYERSGSPGIWHVGIVGLTSKVGDNVFTVDWRGRQHRTFVRVCLPQIFYVDGRHEAYLETPEGQAFAATLPPLEPDYLEDSFTSQGDHKHAARYPALRRAERMLMESLLGLR